MKQILLIIALFASTICLANDPWIPDSPSVNLGVKDLTDSIWTNVSESKQVIYPVQYVSADGVVSSNLPHKTGIYIVRFSNGSRRKFYNK